MHITTLEISTKKGETQSLRFLVVQEIPHPVVGGSCSSLSWQNGEGLFRQFGNPAKGLTSSFYCYQLKPGDVPENYNRTHFAGVQDYTTKAINPGAATFRGKDLGELTVYFNRSLTWPSVKVRGGESPTDGERAMIMDQIVPALVKFIEGKAGALRADAIAKIESGMSRRIQEAKDQLAKLEQEAKTAIENLKGAAK